MRLVKPSFEILQITPNPLGLIERAGRTCYKSEDKITANSKIDFASKILKMGHESVIEHSVMTVSFIVNRGVTHELVRHRLASYSQESTRYCNYRGGVSFIVPCWTNIHALDNLDREGLLLSDPMSNDGRWLRSMARAEDDYLALLEGGWAPQQARDVLPNATKTEIVTTANLREWRHIFKLRCSKKAHPQMREIMRPLLTEVKQQIAVLYDAL